MHIPTVIDERASIEVLRSNTGVIARRQLPARLTGNSALRDKQLIQLSIQIGNAFIITGHVISEQIFNNLDVVDDALPCRKSAYNSANCTHLMELSTPSAFCE